MMSTKDDAQKLPPKEHKNFQNLIKYYDSKQFNPALGEARTILKKFPNHGETISMKALVTFAMGKRDEADKLAKEGLRNNFKSATCWHVIGILETKRKNYDKAITAHTNALKNESTNYIVLRDLAGLQHVLRKYEDYRNTRADMVPIKSSQNLSWVGFATANYHCGTVNYDPSNISERQIQDFQLAIDIFSSMVESMSANSNKNGRPDFGQIYDVSELHIFIARLMMLQGKLESAASYLEDNQKAIADNQTLRELLGLVYLKLGQLDKAQKEYTWLISRNPENLEYYEAFERIIRPRDLDAKLAMFDVLNGRFPRAISGKREVLNFLPAGHSEFESRLRDYLLVSIKKGRPALFQDMKSFYPKKNSSEKGDEAKMALIEKAMVEMLADSELDCGCYPWVCYYLTKHFTRLGRYDDALKYVDLGIEHTPTLVELYVVKAKIYRKLNELSRAVQFIIEAQELDTADRFTNCIACKYLISNNEIPRAEEMLGKFVRNSKEIADYLRELQTLWFETEAIKTTFKNGNYGECLRRCHLVKRIYGDMFEDQHDFAQYCMRKHTISSFADFHTFENNLHCNSGYQTACIYSALIYFKMLDEKNTVESSITKEQEEACETIKKKRQEMENKAMDDDGWGPKKETVLDPVEMIRECTSPLEEVQDFLDKLELQAKESVLTSYLSLEVNSRRKNYAKCLQAIYRGCSNLKKARSKCSDDSSSSSLLDLENRLAICNNQEDQRIRDRLLESQVTNLFMKKSKDFLKSFASLDIEDEMLAGSLKFLCEEMRITEVFDDVESLGLVKQVARLEIFD